MKTVNLTCEWILDNFSGSYSGNGDGTAYLISYSIFESRFVTLAFETMGIEYTEDEYFEDLDDMNSVFYEYIFKIEDVKEDCPKLYKRLVELNENNRISYLRNRLTDTNNAN